MKKTELIKLYDSIEEQFYNDNVQTIIDIIRTEMKFVEVRERKDIKKIKGSEGFYIILRNKYRDLECRYKNNGFIAVYRGHASKMRERIESHLFYDPANDKYQNCMKISIDDNNNININIETKKTYKNGKEIKCKFPSCKWKIAYVSLNKSKQHFREMFEKAFDSEFCKPEYSMR